MDSGSLQPEILRALMATSPENTGDVALFLAKIDSLTRVLAEKLTSSNEKLDELRAEIKGLRIDMQGDIRNVDNRVRDLEMWKTSVVGSLAMVRYLFGTSVLAVGVTLWEVYNHAK